MEKASFSYAQVSGAEGGKYRARATYVDQNGDKIEEDFIADTDEEASDQAEKWLQQFKG